MADFSGKTPSSGKDDDHGRSSPSKYGDGDKPLQVPHTAHASEQSKMDKKDEKQRSDLSTGIRDAKQTAAGIFGSQSKAIYDQNTQSKKTHSQKTLPNIIDPLTPKANTSAGQSVQKADTAVRKLEDAEIGADVVRKDPSLVQTHQQGSAEASKLTQSQEPAQNTKLSGYTEIQKKTKVIVGSSNDAADESTEPQIYTRDVDSSCGTFVCVDFNEGNSAAEMDPKNVQKPETSVERNLPGIHHKEERSESISAGESRVTGMQIHKRTVCYCSDGSGFTGMQKPEQITDMQVFVITSDTNKIAVDVKPNEFIKDIMLKLKGKVDYSADNMSLNWSGKNLDLDHTVQHYNIPHNAELVIFRGRKKDKTERRNSSSPESSPGALSSQGQDSKQDDPEKGESDDEGKPTYRNDLDESTGNQMAFTEVLVTVKRLMEGENLTLKCSVNKQDMVARWFKDKKPLPQDDRIKLISKHLTHSLEIKNVCPQDSGDYSVKIEGLMSMTKVFVTGIPLHFTEELAKSKTIEEGSSLNLKCSVNKESKEVSWFKDDTPLPKDDRIRHGSNGLTHSLEIQNACPEDSGEYSIKVENLTSSSKIIVKGIPLHFTEELAKSETIEEGSTLNLKCSVNKESKEVRWFKDNNPLPKDDRIRQGSNGLTHSLEIQNLCPEDSGEYSVQIENLISTSKVTVEGKPLEFTKELNWEETLAEGFSLSLICSVNRQNTQVKWFKDQKRLHEDDRINLSSKDFQHSLVIRNTCQQDSGEYSVEIENLTSSSKVIVEERHVTVDLPLKETIETKSGQDVVMKCIVSKPDLKAKWTFNGKVISDISNKVIVESSEMSHQLTIKNVTVDNGGEYCLEIENIREKTILKVHDENEGKNIQGAEGSYSQALKPSSKNEDNLDDIDGGKPTQKLENEGSGSEEEGEYVLLQQVPMGSKHQMNSSHIQTHEDVKSSFLGKDGDRNSYTDLSPDLGSLKKARSLNVPAGKELLLPQEEYLVNNALRPSGQSGASKTLKQKQSGEDSSLKAKDDMKTSACGSNMNSMSEDRVIDELIAGFDNKLNISEHEPASDVSSNLQQTDSLSDHQTGKGKERSPEKTGFTPFNVKFKLNNDEQMTTTQKPFDHFMKYHYFINNRAYFNKMASHLEKEKHITISVTNGILQIEHSMSQRNVKKEDFKMVFDQILKATENIVVNSWPTSGVNIKKVYNELERCEEFLANKMYIRYFEDYLHVACDRSLTVQVNKDIEKSLKRFADKNYMSKVLNAPFIFCKILESSDLGAEVKNQCGNVDVKWDVDYSEDVLKIVFDGHENDVSKAMHWFDQNYIQNYGCCSENMMFPELDLFHRPEVVVLEYLNTKYGNQTDIVYDLNEERKKVWLCSKTDTGKATAEMKALAKKGCIVKTLEIPFDGTLHDVKQINKSLKESNYTVTQVEENKIIVKGLEKYVYEVKQKIEGMLHFKPETDQALSGNIIEYDNFLLYIEENGVLENLFKKHEIQYSYFHNNNKKGFYYTGEETNCSQFHQELERLKGSYITHNIAVNLGDRMDNAELDEHLHIMEKGYEGNVKVKRRTATSPDKFTADTVIGVTLEDDLRDCLYTQWHEDGYTVTVVEGISEVPSADLVLVPVDGKSNPDFSQGIAKKVVLPIPEKSGKNPVDAIQTSVNTILTDETVVSVCITLPVINGWKNYVYIKRILYALKTYMSKSKGPRKDIVFCCCDRDAYDYCFEYCSTASKTKYETVMPINKDRYMDKFCIEVKKGGIVDFEVDVIVNTTATNLDLSFGAVSSTILKNAGPALQQEVKMKKPKGIQNGEILETSSFNLDKVEIILHGALASYNNRKDLQKLEEFVIRCFRHADSKHFKSIALPAIGTGNLGYKKQDVAATMFKAAKKFFRDNHPSYLRQVLFVIYSKDGECLKAFEAEEKLWNEYLRYQARAVAYNRVRVQPHQGSISETLSDVVIYLWDEGKVHGSFPTADTSLMKACGKNVYEKVSRIMRGKKEELVKEKAENINADVYFKNCQNSFEKIYSAISHCLQEADKSKDVSSICIAFDTSHTFLLNDDLTYALCEAIKDISLEIRHIKQVEIMVEGDESFSAVFKHFEKEKNGLLKLKEPVTIEISGFEEHVVKAVDELTKRFSKLPVQDENDIPQAEGGYNKEKSLAKGIAKETIYIEPDDTFEKYVEVHNIPDGIDNEALGKKIFRQGKFPIAIPILIYFKGSDKALLICQSKEDAIKLSQCKKLDPFRFSSIKGKELKNLTWTESLDIMEKIQQKGKYEELKEKLSEVDIQVRSESPLVLVAPTTFQLKYVKFLIAELAEIESTQTSHFTNKIKKKAKDTAEDSFSIIEGVQDVPENVWEVLYCSEQYKELKKNSKISYNNGAIIFEPGMEECKDELQKINELVKELRNREWGEIHLEKKDQEKSTVDKWCEEMKETIGYECCKYIVDKGNVLVYAKKYEDIQIVKHVFSVKTGKIKPTARGRRGKASSDKDETNTGNVAGAGNTNPDRQYESIGAPCRSPNWNSDCKKKEYKTNENISVYVYEANILDLKVDCIVNAANESMQHGGGVAAVIARAAGYDLNDECFDYIKKNGKVPVGKACTTSAGNLKYDCVIHAVGPRWSDYYPKTHEKVKECETHLYQAIYNSFLEAEKKGLKSIALPAISSAIFGVPEEICVSQYTKATMDYSRKTKDQPSALTEIHFIDKNKDIVKKIDSAFHSALIARDMPSYDINKFVKSKYRKGSPEFHAEAQASASNSIYGYSTKGASQSSSCVGYDASKVEPLSYFDKFFTYVYLLHGKEEHKLIVSQGDMLKVKAKAVVVPIDNQGRGGKIAESLIARIPKPYKEEYYRTVSSKCHNARLCDVLDVPGYECGYPHILLAVYPASAKDKDINKRKHDVQKLYDNIFSACKKQPAIHAVVTTLLGADMRSAEDIKTCAEMFLQSYLKFYSKPLMKDKLRIHLVCKEDLVYHCVKEVLDTYVMSRKSELEKTLDDNDSSPPSSATDDVKPDDTAATGEGENCVICIDTITDPEKLKCGHVFCKDCIQAHFKFKQACPTCGQVCGIITGDQPEGYMNYTTERYSDCSGYEGCGKIAITYTFPSGRQETNHPSPGKFYKGITRVAYLPNNEEGRKILEMLKIAFQRKLVFTIGNSRTTGQEGVITWNDIHHKTNPKPYSQFGYPDPGYLERVKDELAVKGVTEKDIEK